MQKIHFNIGDSTELDLSFESIPAIAPLLLLFEYVEHIQQHLPAAKIVLHLRDDDTDFIQRALYDGASIIVKVTNSTIDYLQVMNLRVFGTPSPTPSPKNEGFVIEIFCLLDFPKFFHAVAKTGYEGSVSTVLGTLARECDLVTQAIQTGDSQFWYTYGRSYADMVEYLVDHCYISPTSLPASCVCAPNIIVMKDIMTEIKKTPKYELFYKASYSPLTDDIERKRSKTDADTTYIFHEWKPKNITGVLNSSSGYGNTFIQHALQESSDFEASQVTFLRAIANSEINKKIKAQVERTTINYLPFNTGNTYDKFYQAYTKNIRLRDVFSNVLKIVSVDTYTKIRPMQNVQVSFDRKFEESKDATYSGKYIVIGKTINITRNVYRELFTVANYGRNMKANDLI